ncbi:hypothetical protein JCM14036_21490 [Desulfotomaculum defluvii]
MPTIRVTSTEDSGLGSLRQVIAEAESGDIIKFNISGSSNTITLTSGVIVIGKNLTIDGPGAEELTISGNNTSLVFDISNGFEVTIQGISIINGNSFEGGAIRNHGTTTFTNCTLSDNTALVRGGAICNFGTATFTNCTLFNNTGNYLGGAICNFDTGTATFTNCSLFNNTASYGGAISNDGTATLTVCTLSNNSAHLGGAIINHGTATVTNCTLSDNTASDGGAICNYGTATVTNCTLSNNTASYGGAIFNYGTVTIINSTLSNNSTQDSGGAIYNGSYETLHGIINISFSTIAENHASNGAGIYCDSNTSITIKNSIIANNLVPNFFGGGTFTAFGVNFSTDDTLQDFIQVKPDELKLGPLALNPPGTTMTHGLLSGSVAIDSVKSADCTVSTDQRGVARPQNSACDAGAYEYAPPTIICLGDICTTNDFGQCSAKVDFNVSATSTCPNVSITCEPSSGSSFPVGTTTVSCTATNTCTGDAASCSFAVTVTDDEPPTITCPKDITVFYVDGLNGAWVNFNTVATDNCPCVNVVNNPPSGSFFPLGTTVVTCTAIDAAGNTASCSFNVTVIRQVVIGQPLITNHIKPF